MHELESEVNTVEGQNGRDEVDSVVAVPHYVQAIAAATRRRPRSLQFAP